MVEQRQYRHNRSCVSSAVPKRKAPELGKHVVVTNPFGLQGYVLLVFLCIFILVAHYKS